jgi:hypothetical protein
MSGHQLEQGMNSRLKFKATDILNGACLFTFLAFTMMAIA